ncbi:glutamate--cysteine ligase, chloroplastic [Arachis hypogaea]|uniref:glutamate--cysteine ligase, chloroplastic n=1 Tax=Arachis hypogaea TaxID=3818 RepID=UPI003B220C23
MEMRGADGGTSDMLCALPAFWVGLLHDEDFLHNALDIIVHWTPEERQNLRNMVPITGLRTPFQGKKLLVPFGICHLMIETGKPSQQLVEFRLCKELKVRLNINRGS